MSADKAGTGGIRTFVDTAPNSVPGGVGLLCYEVWAYDFDGLYDPSMSQDLCVNGALDPYDSQIPRIAAPSLDSVQLFGSQVTVKWTDRAVDEDGFRVYRRDTNHNPSAGDVVSNPSSTSKTGLGKSYTFVDTLPIGTTSHRWCYYVADYNTNTPAGNPSSEKCTKALPAVSAPAPGLGTISTPDIGAPDQSRITGEYSSVAIGTDGLPLIAYLTIGRGGPGVSVDDLMVAHCADVNCTSTTSITTIDAPGDVGWFPSMKIGSDGLGIIAYVAYRDPGHTAFLDDLRVAHCSDVACTSATITTLDAPSLVDAKPSLAIASDGLPTIGYQDDTGYLERFAMSRIKVLHCADNACTSAATIRTVDTVPSNGGSRSNAGGGVSIAASPTGLLYLTYLSNWNVLKTVTCSDPSCTVPSVFVADQFPGIDYTGWYPSLAIGRDGLPLISYFRDGGLTVAHCVNISCSGVTATSLDIHVGFVWGPGGGKEDTIAIGADGLGVISYFDGVNLNLKVAHCTDLVCGAATTTTIDEFGDTGRRSAITIGTDGLPMISYAGISENSLKVAHCPNSSCTGEFTVPFITGNH